MRSYTGVTVRKTIDDIIAASTIKNNLTLLGNDLNFELIAKCTKLKYEMININQSTRSSE